MEADIRAAIASYDSQNMLQTVLRFEKQFKEAWDLAAHIELRSPPKVSTVVVFGVGGSGISGDIVRVLCENEVGFPIVVCKGYGLPAFVNSKTLAFAVSYSGNTEEVLSVVGGLLSRGATVICVTSGGKLKELADREGLNSVVLPPGYQPRAAVCYLAIGVLGALEKLGLWQPNAAEIEETASCLRLICGENDPERKAGVPPMLEVARRLHGSIPVIYGSEGISQVAALRLKCQVNENGKQPAFWNFYPELNHNETVGWDNLSEVIRSFCLVNLIDHGLPRNQQRMEVTTGIIGGYFRDVVEVSAVGKSRMARLFSLICKGDIASVYLAILNGVDPTPVERINVLKEVLSRAESG